MSYTMFRYQLRECRTDTDFSTDVSNDVSNDISTAIIDVGTDGRWTLLLHAD